jgi:hypothetical protein
VQKNAFNFFIVPAIFLASLVSSCAGIGSKGEKASDDWSRSVVIGQNASGSIGMAVAESGESVHLVWPYKEDGERKLRFVRLDEAGSLEITKDLVFPGHLRTSRLVTAGPNNLHLLWVTREPGAANWELWHQFVTSDGSPAGQPQRLTERGFSAGDFGAVTDGAEGAVVIWDNGNNKGLTALRLDAGGRVIDGPHPITDSGSYPSFRIDPDGEIHLAWLDERSFFYTELAVDDLSVGEIVEVVDLDNWGTLNTAGDSLQGPALGYADGWVYLFWSIVSLTDTEAGTGVAEYVAFPEGSPSYLQPQRLWALPVEDQPYIDYDSPLALTQLSRPRHIADAAEEYGELVGFMNPIAGDWVNITGAASDYMLSPSTMVGNQDELAVALAVSQDRGSDSNLQIATNIFSDGLNAGYSFAGKTAYISDDPVLAVDQAGDMYLAWREGASGETIYFATTDDEAKEALDRLDLSDIAAAIPQSLSDGVSSVAFAPFLGLCWVLPGIMLLGLWQLLRDSSSLRKPVNWLPLGVSLILYYVLKLAFLPTFTTYIPLSAWLYIPPGLEDPLRIGFPILIAASAAAVALWARQRFGDSTLIFFISWVLVDGLFTLAIYGVNILGTF